MQKARRHPIRGSDRLRAHGFRLSFTPLSAVLFTFPSRYCALSVSRECLALADGAAGFGQGSSDPALLRVPARLARVSRTGLSPAPARLSRRVPLRSLLPLCRPYYPARASTPAVWAVPLSLAATRGVTVVFLSSDYWDVSVRRVRLPQGGCRACARRVAPFGHPRIHGRSRLPVVFRGLPRPSSPPGAKASSVRPRSLLALACLSVYRYTVRSCVSFVFVSAFTFPSCQRTAQVLPASVENVGLEPTTPGLQSRCSSQLSQSPRCQRVVPGRLELPTPTLSVWCSNRLSYGTPSGVPGAPAPSKLVRPARGKGSGGQALPAS